ncbi:MFS transporter [Nonlabens xiamenensis]|uniref:MFS transporter n=1 Tax=Nonlabens xiamenensis TaxID=2341043 RepID=UPI000F614F2A|nr:MFS transporter [Nonlabens xiamenensis]
MKTATQKLSIKEKLGYALGDTAANIAWRTIGPFLPIFYTDVFGLEAAVTGILFFVIRIGDGFTDLVMGRIADRTRTKWGKFRPWLLWTALPFGIALVLQFTTPDLSMNGKIIWAYATSILYTLTYTANNVPYSALMGVMTADVEERTVLSSYRFFGAYFGGIIATIGVIALVDKLGGGNEILGYQYTMYILAAILAVFSIITFATTRERVKPLERKPAPLVEDVKSIITNKAWLILLFIGFVFVTYNIIKGGAAAFYFEHYIDDSQGTFGALTSWGGDKGLLGLYLISLLVVAMISTFFAPILTRWLGKVSLFHICIISSSACAALIFFLEPQDVVAVFILGMLSEFGAGIMPVLFFAMLGDAADDTELRTGSRPTGMIFSAGTLAMKFGSGAAGAITLFVLGIFEYDGNIATKTAQMLEGIKLNMSIVPAVFVLIGVVLLAMYPLTAKRMKDIENELERLRQAKISSTK